jgi:hypothetical protein
MMTRLYRWLLFLYPSDYRAIFGREMTEVFDKAHAATSKRGILGRAAFYLRELTGLIQTASYAQIRIHCEWADRMKRFVSGRAAVTALIFMFVAIATAIEILKSFAFHRHPTQPMLWHEFLLAVLAGLTVICGGVIGWAILFLLGRSGVHRIANIDTGSRQK